MSPLQPLVQSFFPQLTQLFSPCELHSIPKLRHYLPWLTSLAILFLPCSLNTGTRAVSISPADCPVYDGLARLQKRLIHLPCWLWYNISTLLPPEVDISPPVLIRLMWTRPFPWYLYWRKHLPSPQPVPLPVKFFCHSIIYNLKFLPLHQCRPLLLALPVTTQSKHSTPSPTTPFPTPTSSPTSQTHVSFSPLISHLPTPLQKIFRTLKTFLWPNSLLSQQCPCHTPHLDPLFHSPGSSPPTSLTPIFILITHPSSKLFYTGIFTVSILTDLIFVTSILPIIHIFFQNLFSFLKNIQILHLM